MVISSYTVTAKCGGLFIFYLLIQDVNLYFLCSKMFNCAAMPLFLGVNVG